MIDPVDLSDPAVAQRFDQAVAETPDVDRFTSSSPWTLSVREAFLGQSQLEVLEGENGFAAFFRLDGAQGLVLGNTDQMWQFNCPLASPDPAALIRELVPWLSHQQPAVVVLSGLPLPLTEPWGLLRQWAGSEPIDTSERLIVELGADFDAWLARRSRKFRANLRNAERRAVEAGLVIEQRHHLDADDMLEVVLEVEARSWKAEAGSGLNSADMARFYRLLLRRLSSGQARLWVARHNTDVVGYVLGAVRGISYRGLQQSFDAERASQGVGAALAAQQLRELAGEGITEVDMGMPMAYKARWADRTWATQTVLIR